jgi:hypothetical protein
MYLDFILLVIMFRFSLVRVGYMSMLILNI